MEADIVNQLADIHETLKQLTFGCGLMIGTTCLKWFLEEFRR